MRGRGGNKKRWKNLLSYAIVALALVYFAIFLAKEIPNIPPIQWRGLGSVAMVGTILLYAATIGLMGFAWTLLLRDGGVHLPAWRVQTIYAMAQFGKYLPGNVGQHVGRVVMATAAGIPAATVLSTMLIELLWVAGVGATIALVSMVFFVGDDAVRSQLHLNPVYVAGGAIMLLATPWAGIQLLNRLFPELARKLAGGGSIIVPRFRTAIAVGGLVLLCFATFGVILKLQADIIFSATNARFLELACLFAAAWLAGFLVPGAPGGLGVREMAMVLLLSPALGESVAVGLGLTLRLITTLGDLLMFAIGCWMNKFTRESHERRE